MATMRAAGALALLAMARGQTVSPPASTGVVPALIQFDCQASAAALDKIEEVWSPERVAWCCQQEGAACRFDCQAGASNWHNGWSAIKKGWCCKQTGELGCEGPISAGAFDCQEGLPNWRKGWSDAKKGSCCKAQGLGCVPRLFDCHLRLTTFEVSWPADKREWCCANEQLGCPTTTTAPAFDCIAGYEKWEADWSVEQKAWCCEREGRGCQFDCHAGYFNWVNGWSIAKQAWCCRNEHRGCQKLPHDCLDNREDWNRTWTAEKKDWCCKFESVGCADEHLDCDAGFASWPTEWSSRKKDWCCEKAGRACREETREARRRDCEGAGLAEGAWSGAKRSWCCEKEGKGCAAAAATPDNTDWIAAATAAHVTILYDCNSAFADWIFEWSDGKKEWCCKMAGRGCVAAIPTAAMQGEAPKIMDCNAGFGAWETEWSDPKKDFCCKNTGRGCQQAAEKETMFMQKFEVTTQKPEAAPQAATPAILYDCNSAFADWIFEWSDGKKDRCCKMTGRGCVAAIPAAAMQGEAPKVMDCDAGFGAWETEWSDLKKAFCCQNTGRGCQQTAETETGYLQMYDDEAAMETPIIRRSFLQPDKVGTDLALSTAGVAVLFLLFVLVLKWLGAATPRTSPQSPPSSPARRQGGAGRYDKLQDSCC